MAWLTDEERKANARRDEAARARGYSSAWEETQSRARARDDALVESARRKITAAEYDAIVRVAQRNR